MLLRKATFALVLVPQLAAAAVPDVPAVGALVDDRQRIACSGTLVQPDVVLTAAHCVVQDGIVRWPWGFFLGEDIRLGGVFVRVIDGAVHPGYDAFLHTADLAVLRIAGGAQRSAFVEPGDTVPGVGSAVRVVGFGGGAVGADAMDAIVTLRTDDAFRYEPGTCPGDSGGPALVADGDEVRIAGVVSTGTVGCANARAVATAPAAAWLRDAVELVDPPACRTGDGACGAGCKRGDGDCACVADDGACRLCDGVDLDCSAACERDGVCVVACVAPDPDCRTRAEGSTCGADVECSSSRCVDGRCREPCGAGCPPWSTCAARVLADGTKAAICLPPSPETVGGCAAVNGGSALVGLLVIGMMRRRTMRRRGDEQQGERR